MEDFFNAVRYGSRTHISYILQKDSSLVNKLGKWRICDIKPCQMLH